MRSKRDISPSEGHFYGGREVQNKSKFWKQNKKLQKLQNRKGIYFQ